MLLSAWMMTGTFQQAFARAIDAHQTPAMPVSAGSEPVTGCRPAVRGKFLVVGNQKLFVRGVTYGAFRPDADGNEYHDRDRIERDFAQMAADGFNTVRIPHTMPPRSLLNAAHRHGLRVMVGLSAEQYLGYVIDRKKGVREIEH